MPVEGAEGSDLFEDAAHHHHHPHHHHHHPTRSSTMPNLGDTTEEEDEEAFWSRFDSPSRSLAQPTRQERRRASTREGWQNRAASALRNLRPGSGSGIGGQRRSQSVSGLGGAEGGQQQQPVVGSPGSRTFLIYVIGGSCSFTFLTGLYFD